MFYQAGALLSVTFRQNTIRHLFSCYFSTVVCNAESGLHDANERFNQVHIHEVYQCRKERFGVCCRVAWLCYDLIRSQIYKIFNKSKEWGSSTPEPSVALLLPSLAAVYWPLPNHTQEHRLDARWVPDLTDALAAEWTQIPRDMLQNLTESLARGVDAIVAVNTGELNIWNKMLNKHKEGSTHFWPYRDICLYLYMNCAKTPLQNAVTF